jgi:hypothetical protein
MLTPVPSYCREQFAAFRASNPIPELTQRRELSPEEAREKLHSIESYVQSWESLDNRSPQDRNPLPGEVKTYTPESMSHLGSSSTHLCSVEKNRLFCHEARESYGGRPEAMAVRSALG